MTDGTKHFGEGAQFGWNDDGERVPVCWPESGEDAEKELSRMRQETIVRFLQLLTSGARSADEVGQRGVVMAFETLPGFHAKGYRELGRLLGCSHTEARRLVTRFRKEISQI